MKTVCALFLLVLAASSFGGTLQRRYPELLPPQPPTRDGVRVTYLGVHGYLLEAQGRALLIDPYFTRVSTTALLLDRPVVADRRLIAEGMKGAPHRLDGVLVTHAHIDHLLDAIPIARERHALLVAGPTAINQARSLDLPAKQCRRVGGGDVVRIGPWKIRVYATGHDRLFGKVPIRGRRSDIGCPPHKLRDWVEGETLSYIVEIGGRKIYVCAGGQPDSLVPQVKVGLAILGVALPDARAYFWKAVAGMRPDHVLPSHQDDFFRPMADGFVFGPGTDFPGLYRQWRQSPENRDGRLFLLDYRQSWTLR